jgi:hypothetical protein
MMRVEVLARSRNENGKYLVLENVPKFRGTIRRKKKVMFPLPASRLQISAAASSVIGCGDALLLGCRDLRVRGAFLPIDQ